MRRIRFFEVVAATLVLFAWFNPVGHANEKIVWEAEQAMQYGAWKEVAHPSASGGAYLETTDEGATLEFPIDARREATIAVLPLWWRTGEQKVARRFPGEIPYFTVEQVWPMAWPDTTKTNMTPLPVFERSGPDVVDAYKEKVFFTAPVLGRVGVMHAESQKVVNVIEVDGYVADLIVDQKAGRLFVADAMNNKVIAYDAVSLKKVGEMAVAAFPRSLALAGGDLFVASVVGKALTVIDPVACRVKRQVGLPFAPQHVDAIEDGAKVAVYPMFFSLDPLTLEEHPADRLQYPLRGKSIRSGTIYITGKYDGYRGFSLVKEHEIRTRYTLLPTMERFDVTYDTSPATAQPKSQSTFPAPLSDDPRPDMLAFTTDRMVFTSPSTGNLGVVDIMKNKYLKTIQCGGYLSGLAIGTGRRFVKYLDVYNNLQYDYYEGKAPQDFKVKVYATDALGNRVIVVDLERMEIEKEISVPKMPVAVGIYEPYLFVTCREDRCVAVVDITSGQMVKRIALPGTPVGAEIYRLQPAYASTESYAPRSIAPLRLIVGLEPMCYEAKTLNVITSGMAKPTSTKWAQPPAFLPLYTRRVEVEVAGKKFFADNMHCLRVGDSQWIDVSAVTDRLLSDEPAALKRGDTPGTITLSLDNCPERDWMRGVWSTPDHRMLLQNDTDEFAQWNAVRFSLTPGRHVLRVRAHSRFVRLDALQVWKSLDKWLTVRLLPEPRAAHGEVLLPTYHAVFANDEPVRFTMRLENNGPRPLNLAIDCDVSDYMGERVLHTQQAVSLPVGAPRDVPLEVKTEASGIFHLKLVCKSEEGTLAKQYHFLRLPPLGNPCLLYRKEEIAGIKKRIQTHQALFDRYKSWLRRHGEEKEFLPDTLVGAGQSMKIEFQRWRAVAYQFARTFLEDEDGFFEARIKPLTAKSGGFASQQCDFQFGGALAAIMDMRAGDSPEERERIKTLFQRSWNQEGAIPDSFLLVETPLTPQARAMLWRQFATYLTYERYFESHAGKRGGNLWQDTRHNCACPEHSIMRIFLFCRNFYDMPKYFEKTFFTGYFTHYDMVMPRYDHAKYLGGGPRYNPMKSIGICLSRNPLRLKLGGFKELVAQLETASDAEFDALMEKDVTFCVPLMLAFGWLDLDAPEVSYEELPPAAYFDGEGAVTMKSGWDEDMTDIYFVSGVRDVSYRVQPNHFQIFKAGRALIGTAAHEGDHGNPVAYWGNTVVVGDQWPEWWGQKYHARFDERKVMNRFAPETLGYAMRDYRVGGFVMPSSYGGFFYGGHGYGYYDLTLHSHTRHPYMKDGLVLAYETWPLFDYVAAEAANAWPLEQVSEMIRQLVFIRPDVIVIYDRVKLGPKPAHTAWIAVGPASLSMDKNTFTLVNEKAQLLAEALLPRSATVGKLDLSGKYPMAQKAMVQIAPAEHTGDRVEYLVLMQTGVTKLSPLSPTLDCTEQKVTVNFNYQSKGIVLDFNRNGAVGGRIEIKEGQKIFAHELTEKIDDSYHNWKDHPLYARWTTEPRFKFLVK